MSEQDIPETLHIRETVEQVRGNTEIALQTHFGKLPSTTPVVARFAGKLSTLANKVSPSIFAEALDNACGPFSREIKDALKLVGVASEVAGGAYSLFDLEHVYVVTTDSPVEVLIDASIGQYILGYNQVFVGTREQLKQLVFDNRNSLRKTFPNESVEDFFKRIWGDTTYLMTQDAVNQRRRLQGKPDIL